MPLPSPLNYNPIPMSVQVPPRYSRSSERITNANDSGAESDSPSNAEGGSSNGIKNISGPAVKAIRICCGSDYTVAIQPGKVEI